MDILELSRWVAEHSVETFGLFMLFVFIVAFLWWKVKGSWGA